jgi:hypothetical protein
MNENDLRQALRTTMATATPPPPMSEQSTLDAARLAERRRRAQWAGVGSAAAAVLVIAMAVVVVGATSGAGGPDTGALQPPPTTSSTTTSERPTDIGTSTSWPNGQTDRTASSGPEYDKGVTLLTELDASVPAGFEAPDDLKGTGDLAGAPMKEQQAQYRDTVDDVEVWEYMADAAVTKGDKVGRLLAEVLTPGNGATGEGCGLAPALWGMEPSTCSEVLVDGKKVGVFTQDRPDGIGAQFNQWAGYRYDDGTVVWIAQASFRAHTDFPPLAKLPLTSQRLAELVADPRFRLD